jgi:hypothetical protein
VTNSPQAVTVSLTVTPPPVRLVVASAPSTGRPGVVFASSFRIRAVDRASGVPLASFAAPVTVALVDGTGLVGRTTASAISGEAVFDSLAINAVGVFTLRFSAGGASDTTATITVAADVGGTLIARPYTGTTFEAADLWRLSQAIEVRDANNVLVSTPVQVRARVVRGTGTIISGDVATSAGGLATFLALRFTTRDGIGVQFTAPGFTSAVVDYNFLSSLASIVPVLVNARDSVIAGGATFDVDQRLSVVGQLAGTARFDVFWDPTVLTLVQDSATVAGTGVSVTSSLSAVSSGAYSATAVSSSSGFATQTRLVRLRFRVLPVGGLQTRIETQSLDVSDVNGVAIRVSQFRSSLTLRLP